MLFVIYRILLIWYIVFHALEQDFQTEIVVNLVSVLIIKKA